VHHHPVLHESKDFELTVGKAHAHALTLIGNVDPVLDLRAP
jgi:hypothetical protein